MARIPRNVREGLLTQGEQELVCYTLTTTPWGGAPSNVAVTAIDRTNNDTDVTATVVDSVPGSIQGDVITTPLIKGLTAEHVYRVYVQFMSNTRTLRAYFEIEAEL